MIDYIIKSQTKMEEQYYSNIQWI